VVSYGSVLAKALLRLYLASPRSLRIGRGLPDSPFAVPRTHGEPREALGYPRCTVLQCRSLGVHLRIALGFLSVRETYADGAQDTAPLRTTPACFEAWSRPISQTNVTGK